MSSREAIKLHLPFPPSVNHYWKARGNRRFITKKATVFIQEVSLLAKTQVDTRAIPLCDPVAVSIVAYPPNKLRRDLDNLLKATLDAIVKAGVLKDDHLVHDLHICWGEVEPRSGAIDVEIKELVA